MHIHDASFRDFYRVCRGVMSRARCVHDACLQTRVLHIHLLNI